MRFLCLALIACSLTLAAQEPDSSSAPKKEEPAPIQDNSFLVEEAYNQEFGVVQHIQTFQRLWPGRAWAYSFTQEWPVDIAPRNQLSYTIPFAGGGGATGRGVGDVLLNYRYQVAGNGEARIAFAPRVSLILPTGDSRKGLGAGGAGFQANLALSAVVNKWLVTHWNAGATITGAAKDAAGNKSATYGYNFGQSFVWLATPRVNFLLETVFNSSEAVIAPGQTQRSNSALLNPGVRWAYNFSNGLQIVPGIAAPIGFGGSAGERGGFFYLSFEHPYRKLKK